MVDAIYTRLSGDTGAGGVSTLVSGHIWESEAKQGETYPNLVFRIVSDPSEFYFGGAEDLIAEMQIDIYGRRRSGSAALRPKRRKVRTGVAGSNCGNGVAGHAASELMSPPSVDT